MRLDLLELHGRGYLMDHCAAALRAQSENRRFRAYVTDALMVTSKRKALQFIRTEIAKRPLLICVNDLDGQALTGPVCGEQETDSRLAYTSLLIGECDDHVQNFAAK